MDHTKTGLDRFAIFQNRSVHSICYPSMSSTSFFLFTRPLLLHYKKLEFYKIKFFTRLISNWCRCSICEYFALQVTFITMYLTDCKKSQAGSEYTGNTNVTQSGASCIPWAKVTFNQTVSFPDGSASFAKNYCRNPLPTQHPGGPWCYKMVLSMINSNGTLQNITSTPESCNVSYCGE